MELPWYQKVFDFLYAKKMWGAGIVTALFMFGDTIRTVLADKTISLDEAETAWRALVALLGTLGVMTTTYRLRNNDIPQAELEREGVIQQGPPISTLGPPSQERGEPR